MLLTGVASTVLALGWTVDASSEPTTIPVPTTAPVPITGPAATSVTTGVPPPPVRLLPPVSAGTSTAYTVERTGADGHPATYDPCRAVHYVLSRAHLTPARAAAVGAAFRALSAATGLAFVDDGQTDEAVGTHRAYGRQPGGSWTPVLVGWATAGEYPPLAGDVVGLGGSTEDRHGRLVSGQVAVDVQGPAPGAVLLHELGHLVGLAHVADPDQLMASVATGRTTYGLGDLAGLAAAGAGPCDPAP